MRLPPAASMISSASARIPGRCGTSSMLKLDSQRDQLDHVTCNPLSIEMCSMARVPPKMGWPTLSPFGKGWGLPFIFSGRNSPRRSYGHRSFRRLLISLWPPPLREWLAPESVTSAVSSCHFSLPPPASESGRWRLWDAKLLPYVVLVNTKPQYIVHICILTPGTPPNVPRGTFVDYAFELKSMNLRHFDGSLKDLRGPHRKLAATAAAQQHPSLRATLHEWTLAFWRQVP